MTTVPLDRFLQFLDEQNGTTLGQGAVEKFLSQNAVDPDDLLSFVFFREDTYGRNLVHRNEHFELLLLTWLPGQKSPVHDFGGHRCWVSVHTGELTFQEHGPIADETILPPPVGKPRNQKDSDPFFSVPATTVHSITNASKKPAISLHLYEGQMQRCRVYDERVKRFVKRELTYFTLNGRQPRTHVLELD